MQIQERDRLKLLLNEQVQQTSVIQQVYLVEEGETVSEICMKFYQSEEYMDEIRLLNGLNAEEEPMPGQKIFLP